MDSSVLTARKSIRDIVASADGGETPFVRGVDGVVEECVVPLLCVAHGADGAGNLGQLAASLALAR